MCQLRHTVMTVCKMCSLACHRLRVCVESVGGVWSGAGVRGDQV